MSKRPIAAPFEVGRSVILDPRENAAFCGAAAVRGFRDAWSLRQPTSEAGAGRVGHPALTGYEVPILRRDEVAAALAIDIDNQGEPILSLKKAQLLAQRLGPICAASKDIQNVPPAAALLARQDEEYRWNLVLPITEEDAGEAALQLQEERAACLDALFEVTGFIPKSHATVGMSIARFGLGLPIQVHDIRWEAQRTLDAAHEHGLPSPVDDRRQPLGQYGLGSAQIWE